MKDAVWLFKHCAANEEIVLSLLVIALKTY